MSNPPNKAVLSCITLLASYSSANLSNVNAAEIRVDLDNLPNDKASDLNATEELDVAETANSTVAINAQNIAPDNHNRQPGFVSQPAIANAQPASVSENVLNAVSTDQDNNAAKLEHLVATSTRRIPVNSILDIQPESADASNNEAIEEATAVEFNVSEEQAIESSSEQNIHLAQPPIQDFPEQNIHLAQAPVQDSSGAVGDSFRPEDLTDEELRQLLSVEDPVLPSVPPTPASSFGTPTAYGASGGDAFIGLAGVTDGDRNSTDGSMSLGVGLGDAVESVGVELNVGIISLDGFADDGQIGVKIHKIFPEADNLAVAVGWSIQLHGEPLMMQRKLLRCCNQEF